MTTCVYGKNKNPFKVKKLSFQQFENLTNNLVQIMERDSVIIDDTFAFKVLRVSNTIRLYCLKLESNTSRNPYQTFDSLCAQREVLSRIFSIYKPTPTVGMGSYYGKFNIYVGGGWSNISAYRIKNSSGFCPDRKPYKNILWWNILHIFSYRPNGKHHRN